MPSHVQTHPSPTACPETAGKRQRPRERLQGWGTESKLSGDRLPSLEGYSLGGEEWGQEATEAEKAKALPLGPWSPLALCFLGPNWVV